MHKTLLATFAAGAFTIGGLALAQTADASPVGGVTVLPLAGAAPEITLVSGGCGPFRHRGFNGFCYPNGGYGRPYGYGYGYGRPYGYYGRPYGYGRPYVRPFGFY